MRCKQESLFPFLRSRERSVYSLHHLIVGSMLFEISRFILQADSCVDWFVAVKNESCTAVERLEPKGQ